MLDGATLPGVDGVPVPETRHAARESAMDTAGMHHDMPKMEPEMRGMDHGDHGMGSISLVSQIVWAVLILAMVVAATSITHLFTPVTF